jgi:hypothetical protein
MSVTVSNIIDIVNTDIGDDSNDRVTEPERLSAITEATAWMQEELGNDHQVKVHGVQYSDIKHQYRLDDTIPDIMNGTDLRLDTKNPNSHFVFKSASDVLQDIENGIGENSYGIDRYSGRSYLTINYPSSTNHEVIAHLDNVDDWTIDNDAINLTSDSKEVRQGSGSAMFDVDVSVSVNDSATVKSSAAITPSDLTIYDDLGYYFLWVYIPDAIDITSVDLIWGTDASNYWTDTATEDTYGLSFSDGWNLVEFDWSASATVGSPSAANVSYYEMTINYNATQVDDTGFRFDGLQITNTEKVTLHYTSFHVGEDNAGNDLLSFTATTDVPFFSGQYDHYKFTIGHKASSIIFDSLRLSNESAKKEAQAIKSLERYKNLVPTHKKHETGGFKVSGLNFN